MTRCFLLQELAEAFSVTLVGDPSHAICGVNTLEEASLEDASFLANPRYFEAMKKSHAGVVCIDEKTPLLEGKNYLVSNNPSRLFQNIVEKILQVKDRRELYKGIHPTAIIHPTAKIGKDVSIGAYCVIEEDVMIAEQTILYPHVYIGYSTSVGKGCLFYPFSSIRERCVIGNQVILQQGAVIGSCGFGYVPNAQGEHIKLEQLGSVILEDGVEIGANTTVDRARFKATIVRRGSKIDNLVQIAHNVEIGQDNIIAAQTGIAGSVKTGRHVMIGGQAGIVGHVEIGDQVLIATRGGVSKSIKTAGKYRGSPAIAIHEYHRQEVHMRRINSYYEMLKELKAKVASLEEQLQKRPSS